jgi:peptide-methionine (R)-S-oxide reductase
MLDLRSLSPEAYKVLVERQTEPPGTYATLPAFTKRAQDRAAPCSYHCAQCNALLFNQQDKFTSGTGWPSFYRPARYAKVKAKSSVHIRWDLRLWENGNYVGFRREVICAVCRGHLGHVFPLAGEDSDRQRFCINAHALQIDV